MWRLAGNCGERDVDDGERDGTGRIGEGLAPPSRAGDAEVEGGPEPLVPMETHSESAHVVGETEDDSSLAIKLAGENARDGQRRCFCASRRYRGARGERRSARRALLAPEGVNCGRLSALPVWRCSSWTRCAEWRSGRATSEE